MNHFNLSLETNMLAASFRHSNQMFLPQITGLVPNIL